MTREKSLAEFIHELHFVTRAIGEAQEDLTHVRKGNAPIYNLDFALLCPVLFRRPGQGSKSLLTQTKPTMRRILMEASSRSDFQIVVSTPTIVEFFDQLEHTLNYVQRRAALHIPEQYSTIDEDKLRRYLLTSKELREDLVAYTRGGLDQQLREPIDKLLGLLESGALMGMDDVLDGAAVRRAAVPGQFSTFLDEHVSKRAAVDRYRHNREHDDSVFHYKADAGNNCLTLAAAEVRSTPMYFVTTTALNVSQCTVEGKTYARLDRTPLFLLNAIDLEQQENVRSAEGFLRKASLRGIELLTDLPSYATWDECPSHLRIEVGRFLADYLAHLANPGDGQTLSIQADSKDITRTIRQPALVRELLDEAAENARRGAQEIERHEALLNLNYIDEFDFRDDPVIERMRTNLGILA